MVADMTATDERHLAERRTGRRLRGVDQVCTDLQFKLASGSIQTMRAAGPVPVQYFIGSIKAENEQQTSCNIFSKFPVEIHNTSRLC